MTARRLTTKNQTSQSALFARIGSVTVVVRVDGSRGIRSEDDDRVVYGDGESLVDEIDVGR